MSFDPILADIRFGCGLSPAIAPPDSAAALLAQLRAPDAIAAAFPVETFPQFRQRMVERARQTKIRRNNRGTPQAEAARKAARRLNQVARKDAMAWLAHHMLRRTHTQNPFRERLAFFWGDHFTARGKQGIIWRGTSPYVESAIRPNMTGSFADLLIAAVTHPLMLHYLDQWNSYGPASPAALRSRRPRGLNENLAREVLELHTLGVDGPYSQDDVRQLAELFTGMTMQVQVGFKFDKHMAEPGAEMVLGKQYGGTDNPHIRDVQAVLRDLSVHPATAAHVARKLAVHFVSDVPDPDLVAAMIRRWRETDGDLGTVYAAMLDHPGAWDMSRPNVKQPVDFIGSACRALAIPPDALTPPDEKALQQRLFDPMALMGQIWERPEGPDGWAEADSDWITPQGVAARLQWAVSAPQLLMPQLPDPRDFVISALGMRAPRAVQFAAAAAETRPDGVGIVLASPAFQRA